MTAATILQRLDRVRETGPGRWIACCPAHSDKSPSLSIRELEDGRVLLHDFAGCSALEVLDAVGLDWSALYPPRAPTTTHRRRGPPVPYADALRCLAHEAWAVLISAARVEREDCITEEDLRRLTLAIQRIQTACEVTGAWR